MDQSNQLAPLEWLERPERQSKIVAQAGIELVHADFSDDSFLSERHASDERLATKEVIQPKARGKNLELLLFH